MRIFEKICLIALLLTLLGGSVNSAPLLLPPPELPAKACFDHYRALGQSIRLEDADTGPKIFLPALAQTRKPEEIKELKVGSYNVLNLMQMKGSYKRSESSGWKLEQVKPVVSKPASELRGIAETILRADPDILVLQEVDSVAALRVLADDYLGGKYRLLLIHGNDERGIQIGYLVKNDLPFDLTLQSHRKLRFQNERTGKEEAIFSRDLPMLSLRMAGQPEESAPVMTILGTHFKSQRHAENDKFSKYKRTKQAEAAADIVKKQEQANPNSIVILTGDFNNDVRRTPEFNSIRTAGMIDAFDLSPATIPKENRITHTYHPNTNFTNFSQLDAMYVSTAGRTDGTVKDAQIVRYLDEHGNEKPIPKSIKERKRNPSDHFMIFGVFDFQKMLANIAK